MIPCIRNVSYWKLQRACFKREVERSRRLENYQEADPYRLFLLCQPSPGLLSIPPRGCINQNVRVLPQLAIGGSPQKNLQSESCTRLVKVAYVPNKVEFQGLSQDPTNQVFQMSFNSINPTICLGLGLFLYFGFDAIYYIIGSIWS